MCTMDKQASIQPSYTEENILHCVRQFLETRQCDMFSFWTLIIVSSYKYGRKHICQSNLPYDRVDALGTHLILPFNCAS